MLQRFIMFSGHRRGIFRNNDFILPRLIQQISQQLDMNLNRIGVYRTVAIEPEEVYVIPLPDDELDFGLIE